MSEVDLDQEQELVAEEISNEEAVIRDAFNFAVSEEKDEDSIKLAMITAGATFKSVTRLYNKFMIEAGLAISKQDRNELIENTLSGKSFDDEESFDSAVVDLVEAISGTTERSAASIIRAYAKKNDLTVFAKEKSTGEGNHTGFRARYYDFLVDTPDCTPKQALSYIMGTDGYPETSPGTKNSKSTLMGVYRFAQRIRNK